MLSACLLDDCVWYHRTRARFHSPLFLSIVSTPTSGMETLHHFAKLREPQVLNFLGAKINYGGRVTDDKDKLFLVCTWLDHLAFLKPRIRYGWQIWWFSCWYCVVFFYIVTTIYKWMKHSFPMIFTMLHQRNCNLMSFHHSCQLPCHPIPWALPTSNSGSTKIHSLQAITQCVVILQ